MFKRTTISAGLALALISGAPMAADTPQEVIFELQAVIASPVFRAWKAPGQDGVIESKETLPDGINPVFEPLRVEMTGGMAAIDAKLVSAFELTNGDQVLPMMAMIGLESLSMDSAIAVATAGELVNTIKSIDISAGGTASSAPRAGTYTGSLVVLFEPREDSSEESIDPV
ncbi:MAG: hypothetical protein JHC61_02475 [Burkholderiaceae bacterium]|nr:hypothetical protein [Burkholderiaceae bacterium]